MSRIVDAKEASRNHFAYGITSDPLTQFASVFSALVHDVDHSGAPNNQLIKEGGMLAKRYKNKSVAEQNSIDIAWNLLYCPEFGDLRRAIMPTKSEQRRFRQLLVNSVMATDIMDKDLKNARNARWDRAFKKELERALATDEQEDEEIARNRKATIVIEHLIQASDVAHTMQHWVGEFIVTANVILSFRESDTCIPDSTSIANGMNGCSPRCFVHIWLVELKSTPSNSGIKGRLDSLT
eukprot:scaffold1684_cov214-Amphora_coffeaeformis.AAC.7